jgi:hypothetical protein
VNYFFSTLAIKIKENIVKLVLEKLYRVKLFSAAYNILALIILSMFKSDEEAGSFLYLIAIINISAILVRFGSDNYWLKSENMTLRRTRFELSIITIFSALASFVIWLIILDNEKFLYHLIIIFLIIISQHYIILSAKALQVCGNHAPSLFLQLVGGNFLSIPFFLIFNWDYLIAIFCSNALVAICCFALFRQKICFTTYHSSFFERFHYLPLIYFGAINQNLLAIFSGIFGSISQLPILLLMQRVFGLSSWPSAIFLQRELSDISKVTGSPVNPRVRVKKFFKSILLTTCVFSAALISFCFVYFYIASTLTLALSLNIIFIQCGSLIAAVNSLTPQLLSIHNMGKLLLMTLMLALVGSFFAILSPITISASLGFLIFHVIFWRLNHQHLKSL